MLTRLLLIISNIKFNLFAKLISFYWYPNNEIIKRVSLLLKVILKICNKGEFLIKLRLNYDTNKPIFAYILLYNFVQIVKRYIKKCIREMR